MKQIWFLLECELFGLPPCLVPSLNSGEVLKWDLSNDSGVRVASGSYVALLIVTQNDGTRKKFKTLVGVQK